MGSVDSHGIPKPRDEAGPGLKIDLKMANMFKPTKTGSKPDIIKALGDKLSQKVVDELRDNVQYVSDFDKHLTENKIDDINPQMKDLFDKLRGVQGRIERKGADQTMEESKDAKQ